LFKTVISRQIDSDVFGKMNERMNGVDAQFFVVM